MGRDLSQVPGRADRCPRKKLREAAVALYTPDPTAAEAAVLCLTVEEATGPPVEVWETNWQSVLVFEAMGTQWRSGFSGPTGLDYGAVPAVLRFSSVPRAQWAQVFDDVRVMEGAALKCMADQQKKAA